MAEMTWDELDKRFFVTGVSHGALYIPTAGVYSLGVPWNGLTTVTESPSGAEPNPVYADNIKYLNRMSAEEFNGTIEALFYPDEFLQFDGVGKSANGMQVGQQKRGTFGFSWQSIKGNAIDEELGFILNLVYGAQASPSEKANNTVNETPETNPMSWAISTTPVPVTGFKPTSIIKIDSTDPDVKPSGLAAVMDAIYGRDATPPRLPLPDEIDTLLATV